MSAQGPALEVSELTVHYGKRVAVDSLSLSLSSGEVVGLLGPNGAGKSTLLGAIAGSLMPSHGSIRVGGTGLTDDPLATRASVGFADQPPSLYEFFTVEEHLDFVAATRGERDESRRAAVLASLGLSGIGKRLCRELSFGMRQRVGLAAALVGNPDVVLLDETLNGLDPRAAKTAREVLVGAADAGAAVLMSTHLLGVAERLCHRIVIVDKGQVKVDLSGDELEKLVAGGTGAVEALYLEHVSDEDVT